MGTTHRTLPNLTEQEAERFFERINASGKNECWEWSSYQDQDGYGLFKLRRVMWKAHRIAYYQGYGVDPGASLVCHSCDNPPCCNWRHLFLGSVKDNAEDAQRKDRLNTARGDEHWTRRTPERIPRGKRSGNYRPLGILTAAQVLEIRREYAEHHATQIELARRYDVTATTVHNIVHRKTWTNLH